MKTQIFGELRPLAHIAAVMGCTDRTVRNIVQRYGIKTVRIAGIQHGRPADFGAALSREDEAPAPPKRGRPRKYPEAVQPAASA
jgi:hypothetical protein